MQKRVMIVRAAGELAPAAQQALLAEPFEIDYVEGYAPARRRVTSLRPALILIDADTWEKQVEHFLFDLSLMRNAGSTRKIIMANRAEVDERVAAFELGADDFLVKPIAARELVLRLHAVLRNHQPEPDPFEFESFGVLRLKRSGMEVFVGRDPKKLSRTEFNLLAFMMEHPGEVFSREVLLANLWLPVGEIGYPRIVDVYICRLRDKIEADPTQPRMIVTRRGQGYSLVSP